MKQLSLLDKINVVIRITKGNKSFFIILALLLFLSILFATTNRKNRKESKITYGVIYLITIAAIIIKYRKSVIPMYDAMMNNLFIVFYFPNISVYVAAIIVTNIIMWISMFSKKTRAIVRGVNSAVFFFMHYILVLLLSIVASSKLDVFDSTELYANTDVHSLIELSSNIFLVWIIFLAIYKVIISYIDGKKEEVSVTNVVTVEKEVGALKYINELDAPLVAKKETSFPSGLSSKLGRYINEVDAPIRVKRDLHKLDKYINVINAPVNIKRDENVKPKYKSNLDINIVDNPIKVKQDKVYVSNKTKENISIYDSFVNNSVNHDLFSDNYKEVLTVLQNEYVPNIKTTKEEEQKIERDNQNKLSQLMDLYRSI